MADAGVEVAAEAEPATPRRYGGRTAEQRAAQRWEQLLAAGLERFADDGWGGATVSGICRTAGLSPRYFYEHVRDREELFLAVVDRVADEVEQVIRAAAATPQATPVERARLVLASLAWHLGQDPRRVRVTLVESFATPRFRARRRELVARFSALASRLMHALRDDAGTPGATPAGEVAGALLTGGLVELLIAWATGDDQVAPVEAVDHLVALAAAAARL